MQILCLLNWPFWSRLVSREINRRLHRNCLPFMNDGNICQVHSFPLMCFYNSLIHILMQTENLDHPFTRSCIKLPVHVWVHKVEFSQFFQGVNRSHLLFTFLCIKPLPGGVCTKKENLLRRRSPFKVNCSWQEWQKHFWHSYCPCKCIHSYSDNFIFPVNV